MKRNLFHRAFTLIELLVVIAIIGILSALIIVGMNSTTQKATIAKAQAFSHSVDSALMSSKVSEWNFNNLSGTVDQDISSAANFVTDTWGSNYGTAVGTPVLKDGTNCITGKCLSFNGSTDYIDCGSGSSLAIGNSITISAWLNTGSTSPIADYYEFIGRRGTGSGDEIYEGFYIYAIGGNYAVRFGNQTNNRSANIGNIIANKWINVVATYDNRIYATYYNSARVVSSTVIFDISGVTVGNFLIGKSRHGQYFNGLIDDVKVYNTGITNSQINQNYFTGLNKLFAKQGIEISEYQQRITELTSSYAQN